MMAVLEWSPSCSWIVLVPTSPVGLTDDWLGFLEGIDPLSESSLAAASISLTELGTRIVEAWSIASLSHSKDLRRSPRKERTHVLPGVLRSR